MQEFDVILTVSKDDYGIIVFRAGASGTSRHPRFRSVQDLRNILSHLELQPGIIDELEKMCSDLQPENVRREKMFLPEYVFEDLCNLPTQSDGTVLMAPAMTVLSQMLPSDHKAQETPLTQV